MTRFSSTLISSNELSSIPLAVAYGAVPLGAAAARYLGGPGSTVSVLLPWLLLAVIGTVVAMIRPTPGAAKKQGFLFKITLFLLLGAGAFIYASDLVFILREYMPHILEMAPLIFLLFCFLWASTCGMPDRSAFQRFGALLGVICIIDLIVEVVLYQAVPTVRWIGNADVLAGLLLLSICAGLKPGENDGGAYEPDQGNAIWRLLALVGLLACMSRTGFFAAGWVVLCFGRGKVRYRILFALVCSGLLTLSFLLPATPSDAVRYTDYWLWVETMRLFTGTPALMVSGYPIGEPLPIQFPAGMSIIWEAATGSPASFGVFLPQIPAFWLRLILGWGIIAPLALLIILFFLLFRRLTRMGAGLVAALFAQGMTTPLLYDPAMGIAIGLGFILALSGSVKQNTKKDDIEEAVPESEHEPHPDPADEWNLRPL